MASAKTRSELKVTVVNKPGELTKVLRVVSQAGCDLLAFCGYASGAESGEILMIPDHEGRARRALEAAGYQAKISRALVVPSGAGKDAGARIAGKLSDLGINVEHSYSSSSPGGRSTAVFRVADTDVERALKAFS